MRRIFTVLLAFLLIISSVFPAFAGCRWNEDEGITAEWDQFSYKVKVELYKGSPYYDVNRVSSSVIASEKESKDFTQTIIDNGPGTYTYVIKSTDGNQLEISDALQVSDYYYMQLVAGHVAPTWQLSNGKWYLIDPVGTKLKGWHKVSEKWYYMSENTGVCYINKMTPDGYYVDENGAWDGKPSIY